IPICMTYFLIDQVDAAFFRRASKVMGVLLVLHVLVQIGQFFFASAWFGENRFGFAARSPGMFLIPSTAALFAILAFFLTQFYSESRFQRTIVPPLCLVSIVLTASGTGYVVFLLGCLLYFMGEKYARLTVPLSMLVALLMFPVLML